MMKIDIKELIIKCLMESLGLEKDKKWNIA